MGNHRDHTRDEIRFERPVLSPSPPRRLQRCENCAAFAPETYRELPPTCRLKAPVGAMIPGANGPQMVMILTPTKPELWCLEWKAITAVLYEELPQQTLL